MYLFITLLRGSPPRIWYTLLCACVRACVRALPVHQTKPALARAAFALNLFALSENGLNARALGCDTNEAAATSKPRVHLRIYEIIGVRYACAG